MSWTVIEIDGSGRVTVRSGGTLTGEAMAEPEPEPKPKMVTWRLCARIWPHESGKQLFYLKWHPSGNIPQHYYPIESYTQPVETVQQLPEGCEP